MKQPDLMELAGIRRTQANRLGEVMDLTRQMAQAADRRDETSFTILLSMRDEPIRALSQMEHHLTLCLERLEEEDAIRARELLEGGPAEAPSEEEFVQQNQRFRSILNTVVAADKQLSLKMGGKRSFYNTFRD